jgi:hypothetical protein
MNIFTKKCSLCGVNKYICFWGDMPIRKWKRPVLGTLSALVLVGGGYAIYETIQIEGDPDLFFKLLMSFVGFIFFWGLVNSIFGCDRCVAKAFGSA